MYMYVCIGKHVILHASMRGGTCANYDMIDTLTPPFVLVYRMYICMYMEVESISVYVMNVAWCKY